MRSMNRHFIENNHYDKAETITVELVQLPDATDSDFYLLAKLDFFKPPAERPTRPYHMTMDAGLER